MVLVLDVVKIATILFICLILEVLSLKVRRPDREADYSPPSSAEVKECVELYLHFPNTFSWRGAWLSTGITLPFLDKVFLSSK
jgi:hypothetical protein